jgi:hypothetical protein
MRKSGRSPIVLLWVRSRALKFSPKAPTVGTLQTLNKVAWSGGVPPCRYVSRPTVSEKRLALNLKGSVSFGWLTARSRPNMIACEY